MNINILVFLQDLKILKDKHEELDLINVPEKYLDPIMGSIIKEPIYLPQSDTIMDKSIIMRYLLDKEENPFAEKDLQ